MQANISYFRHPLFGEEGRGDRKAADMRYCSMITNSIGILEIELSEGGFYMETMDRDIARFFSKRSMKGAVVVLLNPKKEPLSPETVDMLSMRFEETTVPLAAVFHKDADNRLRSIASACLFQYIAEDDSLEQQRMEAEDRLRALTDKRPCRVIRAVMKSLYNAEALPLEKALLKETKLFCDLSKKKSNSKNYRNHGYRFDS